MLGIVKGDVRYTYLSQLVNRSILSDRLEDFYNVHSLLLPLGGINSDYSIKQSGLNLLDILNIARIRTIYTGNANKELKELCQRQNIRLVEFLKNPEFVAENAFLTAKALLYYIHKGEKDISDFSVLVLGYGNIGFYLSKLFKAAGVRFAVYTEEVLEQKYARLEGYVLSEEITSDYDIIINTIPKNLKVDYTRLKSSRILDVASAPYGFDLEEIMKHRLDYEIHSALPSKYAPCSAAYIIKRFIEKYGS